MIIKTKRYQLTSGTYIKIGMMNILKDQWWVILIALALSCMIFVIHSHWWWIGSLIALILYSLFWLIQFAGVSQLEQNKVMFEKFIYEITSQQILMRLNVKQGMPVQWDSIKKAVKTRSAFLLILSKAQFIYLPFRVFNSDAELKFMEAILKRKGYIKEK